ncbi:MAG: hypothetical protein ACYTGN_05515 [Planctomycetota bacterium]|jgi:hypothetical protein
MAKTSGVRRLARLLKWPCTAAALLVLVAIATSPRFEVDVTRTYSIRVEGGNLGLRAWGIPRAVQERDPYHSTGPDTLNIPLWFMLAVCAAATACLWRIGRDTGAPVDQ